MHIKYLVWDPDHVSIKNMSWDLSLEFGSWSMSDLDLGSGSSFNQGYKSGSYPKFGSWSRTDLLLRSYLVIILCMQSCNLRLLLKSQSWDPQNELCKWLLDSLIWAIKKYINILLLPSCSMFCYEKLHRSYLVHSLGTY